MNPVLRFFLFTLFLFINVTSFAQDNPEMADVMRSNGKIYVVVAVCLTILFGLILYLVTLDRKISRLEKGKHN
ncbi:MAG: CcmD family protein [Chitinophagaceae bacterium]|nr:MAG: CcmD family protein [Chitinophagaceae bacterium]